jgi:hypothetical protein
MTKDISSTKSRCKVKIEFEIFMPYKFPFLISSLISTLTRHSYTNRKNNGDNGKPCQSHLKFVKKPKGYSLINVTTEI